MSKQKETRIYILDTPFISIEERNEWLTSENIWLPKEDHYASYYKAGELGKIIGKYLLSKGWKFHVETVEITD